MAIIGVSFDAPEVNEAWAEEESYLFELWTDDDRTLAVAYGAAASTSTTYASRKTMLLDADGTQLLEYLSVSPSGHARDVLEDCTALFGR